MRRREFITLLGGAAVAWPRAARAQQAARSQRIGVLEPKSPNDTRRSRGARSKSALRESGWVEGRNVLIDFRWAAGRYCSPSARRHRLW